MFSFDQVVDGWELNGAVFPSYEDHEKKPANRFHDICVESKQALPVRRVFTSSQNGALIQYRIPAFGQGFSVRVEHIHNPRRKYYFYEKSDISHMHIHISQQIFHPTSTSNNFHPYISLHPHTSCL